MNAIQETQNSTIHSEVALRSQAMYGAEKCAKLFFMFFLLHCRRTASKVDIKGFSLSDVVSLKFLISLSSQDRASLEKL